MSQDWLPHPYQEKAIEFALTRAGSGIMLDPGMGKTAITLAVIDILRHAGEIRKTLVIAPLRVCYAVWPVEAQKWTNFHGLKVVNLHPLRITERAQAIASPDYHIYVINPESADAVMALLGKDFDLLVIDESTKYKDTQTKRFKAMKKHVFDFKRRMILTGTPIPNGLQDLVGQMFIVDFGESLGKYISHFRMEFMYQRPGNTWDWFLRAGADDQIYKRVANKLMRLDAVDHLDMPELVNNFIEVNLPKSLVGQYKELEQHFVTQIESTTVAIFNPSAVGTKLRQMANGFIYDDAHVATRLHVNKLDALEELVEEMQGRPLFVAYEFIEDALMIQERFHGDKVALAVDLGKSKNVDATCAAFNRGEIPLLIAYPGSVGHGLNLQEACCDVCWYGITWNLEWYIQFNDRVYRQGQKSPYVRVHHIVCKGTKDEAVMRALENKDRTQKRFNDYIKSSK